MAAVLPTPGNHTAETALAWLGRQDSNLGMAESKSTCFAFRSMVIPKNPRNSTRSNQ